MATAVSAHVSRRRKSNARRGHGGGSVSGNALGRSDPTPQPAVHGRGQRQDGQHDRKRKLETQFKELVRVEKQQHRRRPAQAVEADAPADPSIRRRRAPPPSAPPARSPRRGPSPARSRSSSGRTNKPAHGRGSPAASSARQEQERKQPEFQAVDGEKMQRARALEHRFQRAQARVVAQAQEHRGNDRANLRLVAQVQAEPVLHPVVGGPREGQRMKTAARRDHRGRRPTRARTNSERTPCRRRKPMRSNSPGLRGGATLAARRGQFQAVARVERGRAVAPIDGDRRRGYPSGGGGRRVRAIPAAGESSG